MASLSGPSGFLGPSKKRVSRRFSLRIRVVLGVLAVAIAPQLLLFAWSQVDRNVPGRLWGTARDSATECARVVAAGPDSPKRRADLDRIAARMRVRVRVIAANGAVVSDADHGDVFDAFDRFEAFFLGDSHPPSLAELDETMGPVGERVEVQSARVAVPDVSCRYVGLLFCQATLRATYSAASEVVLTQRSSRRAVTTVYALRYQLLRLALLTVPIAMILALYMGRRVVAPLEALRDEALAQSSLATRNVGLSYRQADEVGDLARALNELLSALQTKRRENEAFVADLVHELKNPVAAVRASADSVTADLTPERAERISRLLRDSTAKVDRLISQFLELARAEAGLPNEIREPVDLVALLKGLTASASDDERHRGISFELVTSCDRAEVRGVDHRLEASFRELLENAASFAAKHGHVEVGVVITNASAVVRIADDGPGIAPENLARVFDRFFTTRDRERGTGLGLSLVKAVAEAHGGSVTVSSKMRNGAEFSVILPLDSETR